MNKFVISVLAGTSVLLSPVLTEIECSGSASCWAVSLNSAAAAAPKGLAGVKSLTKTGAFRKVAKPFPGAFNGAARKQGNPAAKVIKLKEPLKFIKFKTTKKGSGDPPPVAVLKPKGPTFKFNP